MCTRMCILIAASGILFIIACQVAAFSARIAVGGARQLHPSSSTGSIQKPKMPLFIGTGFSFNDGNQVLVSVQKPLGITLEQEEGEDAVVAVADVDSSGSAARAGVKVGDVLVAVQNANVECQSLEYVLDFICEAPRVVNLRFVRPNED